MATPGSLYVSTTTTDAGLADSSSWTPVTHTVTFGGQFQPIEDDWDFLFKKIREEEMMYLSDLVIYFGMEKRELEQVKRIMAEKDWDERILLFILCDAVKNKGLTCESLGYKMDE